jgi:hypothetical protein
MRYLRSTGGHKPPFPRVEHDPIDRLLKLLDIGDPGTFVQVHEASINTTIMESRFGREPRWTEGLAVGSEQYVKEMASRLPRRKRSRFETTKDGT